MMPIQLSRRLREWRQEQELQNFRSGLIAHCVLVAAAGKKSRKVPKPLEFFGGKPRQVLPPKDPNEGFRRMQAWAAEVDKVIPE